MRGTPNNGTPRIILHRKHQAISISGSMTLLGTVTISSPKAVDILQIVDSVRGNTDWLVETRHFAKLMQILVHLLVTCYRKSLAIFEFKRFIFLEDGTTMTVQLNP